MKVRGGRANEKRSSKEGEIEDTFAFAEKFESDFHGALRLKGHTLQDGERGERRERGEEREKGEERGKGKR